MIPADLDANVAAVVDQLITRAEHGKRKYGVTTERRDIDLLGWLQHLQEELFDAAIYIERLKSELRYDADQNGKA
jgi:hypothetical protein